MPSALATQEYKRFRKAYRQLLKSARVQMDTPLQRNIIEAVAGTAFQAGFAAGRNAPPEQLKLHPWTKDHPKAKKPRG
jgi:hypothetical protein